MALTSNEKYMKRRLRIRRVVKGTAERPRLCLHRSNRHLYAQIIDDTKTDLGSVCLLYVSTNNKENKDSRKNFCNIENAKKVAALIAENAKAKGISKVVFDRNGQLYHGIVKEFADAARKSGLIF